MTRCRSGAEMERGANVPDPVTARARKWCPRHGDDDLEGLTGLPSECSCKRIAAAVREALEEAEKKVETLHQPQRGQVYVFDVIAALREEWDANEKADS